jgi:hypothetical protein
MTNAPAARILVIGDNPGVVDILVAHLRGGGTRTVFQSGFSFLGKFGESLVEAYPRDMTDLERHWLERLQIIGKVQSRYLWILLITMIFYGALQERVYVDTVKSHGRWIIEVARHSVSSRPVRFRG